MPLHMGKAFVVRLILIYIVMVTIEHPHFS